MVSGSSQGFWSVARWISRLCIYVCLSVHVFVSPCCSAVGNSNQPKGQPVSQSASQSCLEKDPGHRAGQVAPIQTRRYHRDRQLIGRSEARRQVPHTYRYAERQLERQRPVWFTSASFCCLVIWSEGPGGDKSVVVQSDLPETCTRNSKTVKHSWNFKAASCTDLLFQPEKQALEVIICDTWAIEPVST